MHLTMDLPSIALPASVQVSRTVLLAAVVGAAFLTVGLAARALSRSRARRSSRLNSQRVVDGDAPEAAVRSGPDLADLLTMVAAGIATSVAAQGMWRVAGDVLHLPVVLRCLMFAFLEIAVIASAVRARRSMRERAARELQSGESSVSTSTDPDVVAVWVLTCLSALLSSLDSDSLSEHVARLAAPLVAAWLWERGMAVEHRRRSGGARGINWRVTPERILIRLGLADPTDRSASDVDSQRRLIRLAMAAADARVATGRIPKWVADRRLTSAARAAVSHAGLAVDHERQEEMLAHLGVLVNVRQLVELQPASPWSAVVVSAAVEPTPAITGGTTVVAPRLPASTASSPVTEPVMDHTPPAVVPGSPHAAIPQTASADAATSAARGRSGTQARRRPAGPASAAGDCPVHDPVLWEWYITQRGRNLTPTESDVAREFSVPRSTAGRWRRSCESAYAARPRTAAAPTSFPAQLSTVPASATAEVDGPEGLETFVESRSVAVG